MSTKKKVYTVKQALEKAGAYCAYQERSQWEVERKLRDWGMSSKEADQVIAELIGLNFINEERFAKAYAGGKFRMKQWGRNKIRRELKKMQLSAHCINAGMSEITDKDYRTTMLKLLDKKQKEVRDGNQYTRNAKIARYLINKGYESSLVWDEIRNRM